MFRLPPVAFVLPSLCLCVLVLAGSLPPAAAQDRLGALVITEARSRATPPTASVAGGYLTIENTGEADDRLVKVETGLAGRAEIHEMAMREGVMTMRPVEGGLVVPAGGTVELKPGGLHLMFMDISEPLKEGDEMPVRLTFERAGSIEVTLKVGSIGGYGDAEKRDGAASGHGGHGDESGHGNHDGHGKMK